MSPSDYMPLSDAMWLVVPLVLAAILIAVFIFVFAPEPEPAVPLTDPDASDLAEMEQMLRKQEQSQ